MNEMRNSRDPTLTTSASKVGAEELCQFRPMDDNETEQISHLLSAVAEPTHTTLPISYHHRRKRLRVSPHSQSLANDVTSQLDRPSSISNHTEKSQSLHSDKPESFDTSAIQPTVMGLDNSLDHTDEEATKWLTANRMDDDLRGIISKYVRSESTVRCLELAEFTSPYVLACLDEMQIQRLEDFVGHACSLMNTDVMKELFIGPIFAKYPEQFRLSSGAACGLLLAAAEIKKKYCESFNLIPKSESARKSDVVTNHHLISESSQTEFSVPLNSEQESSTPSSLAVPSSSNLSLTLTPQQATCNSLCISTDLNSSRISSKQTSSMSTAVESVLESNPISTSTDTVAMMAAAFQAAAVAATGTGYGHSVNKLENVLFNSSTSALPENGLLSSCGPLTPSNGFATSLSAETSNSLNSVQNAARLVAAVSGCAVTNGLQSTVPPTCHSTPTNANMLEEEVIDLERLKQHSSASATRLASRQFINAHLTRGRDFDMEMEIAITPEGLKRVTGIFYCHLCREKRERTSAVRFSIARNRYPVLSNVLSHLKTHFQYRGQVFPVTQSPSLFLNAGNMSKSPQGLGESGMTIGGVNQSSLAFCTPLIAGGPGPMSSSYPDPNNSTLNLSNLTTAVSAHNSCAPVPIPSLSKLVVKSEQLDDQALCHTQEENADSNSNTSTLSHDLSRTRNAVSVSSTKAVELHTAAIHATESSQLTT